jgi:hypothetical protein
MNSDVFQNEDVWDWIRFDRVETEFDKFQREPILMTAAAFILSTTKTSEIKRAKTLILGISNFYREIFTEVN